MKAEIWYFSPTGTTHKVVTAFAQGLNCDVRMVDLTQPRNRENIISIESDLKVMAVPIYGERIPGFIYQCFKQLNGNGKPLVAICVYGNIGYGIGLAQFARYAQDNRFQLIGAGTFIGEHTYGNEERQVAYKRPDPTDLEQARNYGEQVRKKYDAGNMESITVSTPIFMDLITKMPEKGVKLLIKQPTAGENACNHCGACAVRCPMNAIDVATLQIEEKRCIRCYACVKGCPKKARSAEFRAKLFEAIFKSLGRRRRENYIII